MNKYNCLYCYDTKKVKLVGVASDKEVECICVSVLSSNKKLENVIKKLRDEQFMKEEFEPLPDDEDGWTWYQYDDNPYDYWLSHDEWRSWFDGWSAYRRCNGINE